jgi:gamma-glutamylcyclotransferase (GGCT)/AIG2-like uncharacterized protein YtfP
MGEPTAWVFVYGTLKRGQPNHRLVARFVREVREGRVTGVLVDLGGYPGWLPGDGVVRGELLRLEPGGVALRGLDELEDFFGPGDPRNEYERVLVAVVTDDGLVEAWAYRYAGPVEGVPRLPGGVWPAEEAAAS